MRKHNNEFIPVIVFLNIAFFIKIWREQNSRFGTETKMKNFREAFKQAELDLDQLLNDI